MTALTPTLYLPIEEANRELRSKILVAIAASRRGLAVVIGQQWLMGNNHASMPPGLMLFKGMNARQTNAMRHIKASGHAVAANDEEALGLAEMDYIARDISPEAVRYCDLFLAQGPFHARAMRDHAGIDPEKIETVGNPRLDLLRNPFRSIYLSEGKALGQQYGDYVLFNTNHGCFNTAWGSAENFLDVRVRTGWIDRNKPEDMALFHRILAEDEANFHVAMQTIKALRAARPATTIVVRPHPAERLEIWEYAFQDDPGTHVLRVGNHLAWITGARLTLNTGCTTGLEAALLGAPVLNIIPDGAPALLEGAFLSNQVNKAAIGAEAASRIAGRVIDGDRDALAGGMEARLAVLRDHFVGIEGAFAHETIAATADAFLAARGVGKSGFRWAATDPDRILTVLNDAEYHSRKISLSLDAFRATWKELAGLSGADTDVDIREIGDSVFVVEAA